MTFSPGLLSSMCYISFALYFYDFIQPSTTSTIHYPSINQIFSKVEEIEDPKNKVFNETEPETLMISPVRSGLFRRSRRNDKDKHNKNRRRKDRHKKSLRYPLKKKMIDKK
ncbi:unnamed protein product [Schistosoma rodhaini]|uniref:Uncharacterized protein n=1 Tax=Schistosoma mansoni TaxID=6183 RepID=G4V661_SCHMA|nr:hypothetical protein Smp_114660 [Schistosoma mansoni]CAH8571889.1 unnamed protein product [Schistosoma rodhaini]|eukprot:XP_018649552.1 hypothetical protein Smp_114660 [Schistosoma mansoni]